MSKFKTLLCVSTIGILFLTSISLATYAAVADYMPKDEDIKGYELLYSNEFSFENPWKAGTNITVGSQIWYKNDTSGVIAVIGAVVLEAADNPLLKEPPAATKQILKMVFPDIDTSTWWSVMVYFLTQSSEIKDITNEIKTTESSIEFNTGTSYMILSLDTNYIIWTISFEISEVWWDWIKNNIDTIKSKFEIFVSLVSSYLGGFLPYFSGSNSPNQVPISSVVSMYTSSSDVKSLTTEFGEFYKKGISGFEPLLVLAIAGSFAFLVGRKIKKQNL